MTNTHGRNAHEVILFCVLKYKHKNRAKAGRCDNLTDSCSVHTLLNFGQDTERPDRRVSAFPQYVQGNAKVVP